MIKLKLIVKQKVFKNEVVQVAIRPEDIRFAQENQNDNLIRAKITEIEFLGAFKEFIFSLH